MKIKPGFVPRLLINAVEVVLSPFVEMDRRRRAKENWCMWCGKDVPGPPLPSNSECASCKKWWADNPPY